MQNTKEKKMWETHNSLVEKRRTLAKQQEPDVVAIKSVDVRITALSELLNARALRKPKSIAKRVAAFRLAGV